MNLFIELHGNQEPWSRSNTFFHFSSQSCLFRFAVASRGDLGCVTRLDSAWKFSFAGCTFWSRCLLLDLGPGGISRLLGRAFVFNGSRPVGFSVNRVEVAAGRGTAIERKGWREKGTEIIKRINFDPSEFYGLNSRRPERRTGGDG